MSYAMREEQKMDIREKVIRKMRRYVARTLIPVGMTMGKGSYIGEFGEITIAPGTKIVIGDNVRISHHVALYTSNTYPGEEETKGDIIIKDGAWICYGVYIGEGITIGRNSVVGANSVVTHDVPDNEVWGGVPARFIKKRIIKEQKK